MDEVKNEKRAASNGTAPGAAGNSSVVVKTKDSIDQEAKAVKNEGGSK